MLFKHDMECQELIMEALKYHLLPERRLAMQSSRTKPRKSTVGLLYAVGGMDCTKGGYCCCFLQRNYATDSDFIYSYPFFRVCHLDRVTCHLAGTLVGSNDTCLT